jgi:hypothetical protein
VIVREEQGSFVLVRQHDHALASGEIARRWRDSPRPRDSTLFAVAQHDASWQGPDASVLWNEERDRPYSFAEYPAERKVRAYAEGLKWLEEQDTYAACLCSMHYEKLVRRFGSSEAEERFVEAESRRQEGLREGMSAEELENLDRNLRFLRLCDGLSLFVCLNKPGENDAPPPYPEGFEFEGEMFRPVWEDRRTLRLEPDPFVEPFEVSIPYQRIGKDRKPLDGGRIELRFSG